MDKKILLVEDEWKLRRIAADFLKRENFRVVEAGDGEEALDFILTEKFDLIILDLMLPKINGWELLKEIREKDLTIPVIMLTARGSEDDILKGYELKADEYIVKPVSMKVLVAKVKAFLRIHNMGEVITFGNIVINIDSRDVKIEGVSLELSQKEYELLLFFIKNKGQVLSRERIITSLWGYDYDGDIRAVDSQIKRIRKKLEGKYIKTIRGVGYKIEEE
ncbi:response regulator transcription factor [Fusobacterium sp.]|uniref:response regulator transcription factor n=1 Tax=Fusobacterium sp. TaxID=68766 RepID=UPI002616FF8F|nr:response regulator transcription factor [Fusobacterium sp.]